VTCAHAPRQAEEPTLRELAVTGDAAADPLEAAAAGEVEAAAAWREEDEAAAGEDEAAAAWREEEEALLALSATVEPKGKIHRVDPDFGSALTVSNRDSQSNCWVNLKIIVHPGDFQVHARGKRPGPRRGRRLRRRRRGRRRRGRR
jgi:hypothetical protein